MSLRRFVLVIVGLLLLAGCSGIGSTRPDLARLYENASEDPNQPPVILIHGLAGSTLVDAKTGKEFWPGSLGALAFSNYRDLARMSSADREGDGLVPGDLFYGIVGVDFYRALVRDLETVGRFRRGVPGQQVHGADDRRRYYVLLYDWRKDNVEAVRKLHALIEQIRVDYHDPALKVDIIAHSNGGLIANYYLRYGPNDVLGGGPFTPWNEGGKRVRRLVMLGTPNLGSVTSLERLLYGMRIGVRTIPVEVMATFATPYQALPHPAMQSIIDVNGQPVDLDIYDDAVWRERHWGVYSPDVESRVRGAMDEPTDGEKAVANLQATFVQQLHRAKRFALSLTAPVPNPGVAIAVFGGDCEMTASRAVLADDKGGTTLLFKPGDVPRPKTGEEQPHGARDFGRLMLEPGDGLVTRDSQLAKESRDPSRDGLVFFPIMQSFFLCEKHEMLTANPYFEDNLLYFLLSP
jgi:pimeloyl-ACP methyl ester carboxylesterase